MMTSRTFKNEIYEQLSRIGKASSAPKRLELLDLLCQGPRTVEALADRVAVSIANASKHLQVLKAARLVEVEKKGLHSEYRIADDNVLRFFLSLRTLAEERLAEVEKITRAFLDDHISIEEVNAEELVQRVRRGDVTVIDVRPLEEFQAGHIPGAISIPLEHLRERLRDLPKDRDIIAYCRGPYCVMAIEAVEYLRKKGFTAHRMEQGVIDWRARRWRLETGTPRSKQ